MTIDEAIKHCEEVAEENDLAAGMYEILAENNHNAYKRLTAETNSSRCAECAADHRQLAEWLRELKDLREENKVLTSECNRLIKEKGELLSKVSGSDVLRICQLEEQLEKAKRLLKAAVEDFSEVKSYLNEPYSHLCDKWRYEDEALKLLNDEK